MGADVVEGGGEVAVVDGGEQDEGLAFLCVGDADDGDGAPVQVLGFVDELFNGVLHDFVGHHFAADFGEARASAGEAEEAVEVDGTEVSGFEPAVAEDAGVELGALDVAVEDVGAAEPDHALLREGEADVVVIRVGDAHGEAGQDVADGAELVAGHVVGLLGAAFGAADVGAADGGGFGQAVALQ